MSKKKKPFQLDIKACEDQLDYSDGVQYSRVRDQQRFNVGDILIHKSFDEYTNKWIIETDGDFDLPVKYQYVYESKDGHGVIMQLDHDGDPYVEYDDESYTPLADMISPTSLFEVDPEFADHVILGELDSYDPAKHSRERVQEYKDIDKYNLSLNTNVGSQDYVAANKILSTLKVGQTIYLKTGWGNSINKDNIRGFVKDHSFTVKRIRKVKMTKEQVAMYLRPKNKKEREQKFYYYTVALVGNDSYKRSSRINTMTLTGGSIITGSARTYESAI